MGRPYPNFCLCAFFGALKFLVSGSRLRLFVFCGFRGKP